MKGIKKNNITERFVARLKMANVKLKDVETYANNPSYLNEKRSDWLDTIYYTSSPYIYPNIDIKYPKKDQAKYAKEVAKRLW